MDSNILSKIHRCISFKLGNGSDILLNPPFFLGIS